MSVPSGAVICRSREIFWAFSRKDGPTLRVRKTPETSWSHLGASNPAALPISLHRCHLVNQTSHRHPGPIEGLDLQYLTRPPLPLDAGACRSPAADPVTGQPQSDQLCIWGIGKVDASKGWEAIPTRFRWPCIGSRPQ